MSRTFVDDQKKMFCFFKDEDDDDDDDVVFLLRRHNSSHFSPILSKCSVQPSRSSKSEVGLVAPTVFCLQGCYCVTWRYESAAYR